MWHSIRRALPLIALFLSAAGTVCAPQPAQLTTLKAIDALSSADAARELPVDFEATVTFFRGYEATLFVQDGSSAIYVMDTTPAEFLPGDRVRVKGVTQPSFRTIVRSSDVTLLRHGSLPDPVSADFGPLIRSELDSTYVKVRGIVRSAEPTMSTGHHVAQLELAMDGGDAGVSIDSSDLAPLKGLLDSEVEVTGVASGRFDGKMQQTGVLLHASSFANVKVLRKGAGDPNALPLTPMDKVLKAYNVEDRSGRVRVAGTITYFYPALMAVLQDGSRSIRILTPDIDPLRIGDRGEATGIPTVENGVMSLRLGQIRSTGPAPPIVPQSVTVDDLASGKYLFNLVSIEGKLLRQNREHSQDVYVISSGGQVFSAALRHPYIYDDHAASPLAPMHEIARGSLVRVTGVAIMDESNPTNGIVVYGLLLRSAADVAVTARPSPWNVTNLSYAVGLLLIGVLAFGVRSWALGRKVTRQTAALASRIETEANLERRRSRILEDINRSRPLAEVVEQIAALVSFKLGGVPCWCQIADGARLGSFAPNADPACILRRDIPSRSGAILGTLYACLAMPAPPAGEPNSGEPNSSEPHEAMAMGVGLIELAIETRRLYTDLRHRSEFDQLTDSHNRFSLERRLDTTIAEASEDAAIFGLIFIDLDDFKQVNDLLGHRAGDLYLQEVALRMKRQLRSGDMLARLGGDEFAALAPTVRSRADVEDVAHRLERCFDEPFPIDGIELRGSASVGIALYPEDGKTRDSLLSAADAMMYIAKNARKRLVEAASTTDKS